MFVGGRTHSGFVVIGMDKKDEGNATAMASACTFQLSMFPKFPQSLNSTCWQEPHDVLLHLYCCCCFCQVNYCCYRNASMLYYALLACRHVPHLLSVLNAKQSIFNTFLVICSILACVS